ncbi:hypothetical protein BOTBODRAFT_244094 [Botryobasidium botryosum FD-172 SS1]|uniref:Uncharacterized protein n=1 Tax=Botryobasidium botryosum (strain FD-172 SS1) TaxID=930990 RepID=A0A067M520_BOTB1|nr:hypothetical protein BOTBODRAFT_244094 [Botryobasidium botryosum FD-172 SS1]
MESLEGNESRQQAVTAFYQAVPRVQTPAAGPHALRPGVIVKPGGNSQEMQAAEDAQAQHTPLVLWRTPPAYSSLASISEQSGSEGRLGAGASKRPAPAQDGEGAAPVKKPKAAPTATALWAEMRNKMAASKAKADASPSASSQRQGGAIATTATAPALPRRTPSAFGRPPIRSTSTSSSILNSIRPAKKK